MSNILALDQSLRATGWAIISTTTSKVVACDCIKVAASKDKKSQVHVTDTTDAQFIAETLLKVIKLYKPSKIVFENPVGSRSARSGMALALVKGVVIGLAVGKNLDFEWVTAKEAKKALTNNSTAEKEEIFKKVCKEFPDFKKVSTKFPKYKKHATSDAIAVYLCWQGKI